jgi:HlyD family secretion protein
MSVQNVVTYDVVVDVENSDLALRPGMTATVTLITATKANVLKVPLRALRFSPKQRGMPEKVVKRVGDIASSPETRLWIRDEDGRPNPVSIETGVRDDEYVEVVSGEISEGDEVVIGYRRSS